MTANEAAIKLARRKNISYETAYKQLTGRTLEDAMKLSAEEREKPVKPESKPEEPAAEGAADGPSHFIVQQPDADDYHSSYDLHGVHPTLEAAKAHAAKLTAEEKYEGFSPYEVHEWRGENHVKHHE